MTHDLSATCTTCSSLPAPRTSPGSPSPCAARRPRLDTGILGENPYTEYLHSTRQGLRRVRSSIRLFNKPPNLSNSVLPPCPLLGSHSTQPNAILFYSILFYSILFDTRFPASLFPPHWSQSRRGLEIRLL